MTLVFVGLWESVGPILIQTSVLSGFEIFIDTHTKVWSNWNTYKTEETLARHNGRTIRLVIQHRCYTLLCASNWF